MLPLGTELVQNSFVVPDMEQAVARWASLGVGPFYWFRYDFPTALYRGRVEPLSFLVALGQAGPVQIELIEQLSDGPSAYRDSVPVGTVGFHHVCKITDDYDRDVNALKSRGIVLATELDSNGIPACYADTRAEIGCMLEVVPGVPILRAMYAMVREGANDWNGEAPLRNGAEYLAKL